MGRKMFKSVIKMPRIMPRQKDLLGFDSKSLGLPSMKPKRRKRKRLSKMLRDI